MFRRLAFIRLRQTVVDYNTVRLWTTRFKTPTPVWADANRRADYTKMVAHPLRSPRSAGLFIVYVAAREKVEKREKNRFAFVLFVFFFLRVFCRRRPRRFGHLFRETRDPVTRAKAISKKK